MVSMAERVSKLLLASVVAASSVSALTPPPPPPLPNIVVILADGASLPLPWPIMLPLTTTNSSYVLL